MDYWQTDGKPTSLENLEVSYFSVERFTDSTFGRDLFYKVVEVFDDGTEGLLDAYPSISNQELDPLDVYWREAVRKNRFIFEQVGEVAYVLLRKTSGFLCSCVDPDTMKSRSDCHRCWGVGYEGGYDGPYPIKFTPPNSVTKVKQGPDGKFKSRSAQSYIGPSPILNSGDLIYRFNGERLVILDVDKTTVRGTSLQQTYTTEILRPADFRHRISITNPNYPLLVVASMNLGRPIGPLDATGESVIPLGIEENPTKVFNALTPVDPIPANISLREGVSIHEVSDPEQDSTKPQHSDDRRTNTQSSTSPVFENWNL
jgi:hypothetical protein